MPRADIAEMFELGFAGFLAHRAITAEHAYNELEEGPRREDGADATSFTIRNGLGERFIVDVRYQKP